MNDTAANAQKNSTGNSSSSLQKERMTMIRMSAAVIILTVVMLATGAELEARQRLPKMCGGGCTCNFLLAFSEAYKAEYEACMERLRQDINNEVPESQQHYLKCGPDGNVTCCKNVGSDTFCIDDGPPFRPQPPAGPARPPMTPIPAPGRQ
jgi:hypothetical protein